MLGSAGPLPSPFPPLLLSTNLKPPPPWSSSSSPSFSYPNTYASPGPLWACRAKEGVEEPQHGVGSASRTSSGRGRPAGPLITPGPYISVRHGTCTTPRPPGLGQPSPALPNPTLQLHPCPRSFPLRNPAHLICCTLSLPLAPSTEGTLLPGARNIHYSRQLFTRLVPGVVILGLRGGWARRPS